MIYIDPVFIFTLNTYASFFIAWGLPCVYFGFVLIGKDPLYGQTSWDLQLAEIKRRSQAGISAGAGFSLKPAPKKTNAEGFIPLNQSLLKSVVNQQNKKLLIDKKQ